MNVSGMSVTMLKPYSLLYCIIKISCSYYTKDRHHKLCCDQRMFLRSFKYDTADICRCIDTDHGKKCSCVTSDTFTVQFSACQNNFCKFILFFFRCKITIILSYKIMHQLIYDRRNCYDLFLCDTWKIVIKCTSVYNVLSCLTDICCLINNCRWVTCTSSDSSLTGGKNCCNNARAACCCDQRDIFMFHHDITCFKSRLLNCYGNVVRSACFKRSFVYQVDCEDRSLDCCRMRIKYNCISSCKHSHCIT